MKRTFKVEELPNSFLNRIWVVTEHDDGGVETTHQDVPDSVIDMLDGMSEEEINAYFEREQSSKTIATKTGISR